MAMRAGLLRHLLTIEYAVETQDSYGEPVQSWAALATVWGEVRPLGYSSGAERTLLAADQRLAVVDHVVRIRYRADVTAKMRIVLGARVFDVEYVADRDGRGAMWDLGCREVI